jgi:hypothetical protein
MIEDNSEFYQPQRRELPAGARCAGHPERPATALCEECARPVCAECAPLQGGGHAFCKDCVAGSRMVEAEPGVLGAPAAGGAPPAVAGRSAAKVYLLLGVLALATAGAVLAWAALTGRLG